MARARGRMQRFVARGLVGAVGLALGAGLAVPADAGGGPPKPAPRPAPKPPPKPAADGAVSGTVTDEDGKPLAGASVEVAVPGRAEPARATSDAKGFYAVRGLPTGPASVRFTAKGRVTATERVTVPPTGIALADATLPPGVRYAGKVVDVRGNPVAGAKVTFKRDDRDDRRDDPFQGLFFSGARERDAATTAADGRFEADGLAPSSKYVLVVRHPRFLPSELPGLSAEAGNELTDLEAILDDAAWVTGTVTDDAGKPVAGVSIFAPDDEASATREVMLGGMRIRVYLGDDGDVGDGKALGTSDAAGRFEVGSLQPSEEGGEPLRLKARARGYFAAEVKVEGLVAGQAKAGVTLRLEAGKAVVEGTVVDDRGTPVAGAQVRARARDAGTFGSVTSDAAGRFRFERVATRAKVAVHASAEGHEGGGQDDVAPDTKDTKVTLRRLGRLRVRVLGADGKLLAKVTVRPLRDARNEEGDEGADAGTYAQGPGGLDLPLPLGPGELSIEAEGHEAARVGPFDLAPGDAVEPGDVTLHKAP